MANRDPVGAELAGCLQEESVPQLSSRFLNSIIASPRRGCHVDRGISRCQSESLGQMAYELRVFRRSSPAQHVIQMSDVYPRPRTEGL
jgi:hypothetical protein